MTSKRNRLRPKKLTAFGEKLIAALTDNPATARSVFRRFELHIEKANFKEALEMHESAEQLKSKFKEARHEDDCPTTN